MKKEILLSDYNIPLEIKMREIDDVYTNWHKELKIIYVLKGSLFIDIKENQFSLEENEFIFVNSYDFSSIYSKTNEKVLFLEFLIDSYVINRLYHDFSYIRFKCYSNNLNFSPDKYNIIKNFLSKIMHVVLTDNIERNMLILNTLIELLLFLINNFKSEEYYMEKDINNRTRLIKIFDYMEKNYNDENLNVHEIALYIDLSSQHLLKIFRQNLGITLSDYLNSLRVKKSINDLLYTNKSILELSIENGFNSSKSYHRIFKKIYNMTPKNYKKKFKELSVVSESHEELFFKEKILKKFSTYHMEKANEANITYEKELNLIELDFSKIKKSKVKHYWKKTMSFGKAFDGLRGDIQNQIKIIKSELNPEYIRFTGILNDEMYVYHEDAQGNVSYNYSYVDKLIDFLIKLDLKPYINIGFMPKILAEKDQHLLLSSINVSYPKSINKWKKLVTNLIRHFIEKYGEDEVSSWYFEIWNNPNLKNIYWYESDEKFYSFFSDTFHAIKNVSQQLKVGGATVSFQINSQWANKFLNYLNSKNIKIDFFSFSIYDVKKNPESILTRDKLPIEKYTEIENINFKTISNNIKNNYGKKIESIISEWNLTTTSFNIYNDNCHKALYIIDTVLNNINTVNQIIYWTATENKIGTNIFYGGLGLFTTNNLKKASYNALLLLEKLKGNLVSRGKNHFITSAGDSLQILFYNYSDNNKQESDNFDKEKEIHLNISNFNEGKYKITKYYLNSGSGSIFEAWQEIGSPEKITDEIYNFLKAKEKMNMKIEIVNINGELDIREIIGVDSIIFLDINKIY